MPQPDQSPVIVIAEDNAPWLRLPDGLSLMAASFKASGQHLLMFAAGESSPAVCIQFYYAVSPCPMLLDENGVELTEDMVASMTEHMFNSASTGFSRFQPFTAAPSLTDTLKSARQTEEAPAANAAESIGERILKVLSGEHVTLALSHLPLANDDDAAITLVEQGAHGLLVADNMVLRPGDTFAAGDVASGKVQYYHDESSSTTDILTLRCEDAATKAMQLTVHISG